MLQSIGIAKSWTWLSKWKTAITEAHIKRTEPEHQGSVLADFHTKAVMTESIKIVAHVGWSPMNEVHSASAKMIPLRQTFVILITHMASWFFSATCQILLISFYILSDPTVQILFLFFGAQTSFLWTPDICNWTSFNCHLVWFIGNIGGGLVAKSCLTLLTPWAAAHQAPVSKGFPRQEDWSG